MSSVLEFIAKYPDFAEGLFSLVGLLLLTATYNGLRNIPKAEGILHLLDQLIDVLSITTRKNAPGTFKLPGQRSSTPEK